MLFNAKKVQMFDLSINTKYLVALLHRCMLNATASVILLCVKSHQAELSVLGAADIDFYRAAWNATRS